VNQFIHSGKPIRHIALGIHYSPYLFAKYIIPEITTLHKNHVTGAMKEIPLQTLHTIDIIRTEYQPYMKQNPITTSTTTTTAKNNTTDRNHALMKFTNDMKLVADDTLVKLVVDVPQVLSSSTSTTRLGMEVQEIIDTDPMYGPIHDKQRHMIGIEYEVLLEYKLQQIGMSKIWKNFNWNVIHCFMMALFFVRCCFVYYSVVLIYELSIF
jgi:hypothetical protein